MLQCPPNMITLLPDHYSSDAMTSHKASLSSNFSLHFLSATKLSGGAVGSGRLPAKVGNLAIVCALGEHFPCEYCSLIWLSIATVASC